MFVLLKEIFVFCPDCIIIGGGGCTHKVIEILQAFRSMQHNSSLAHRRTIFWGEETK